MNAKNAAPSLRLVGGRKPSAKKAKAAPALVPAATLSDRQAGYASHARSEATRRAYACDWSHFAAWCVSGGFDALPATPQTVALYLTAYADRLKPATLSRRLVAIAQTHREAGHEPPTRADLVRRTFGGIRREQGTDQTRKAPLLTDDLRTVIDLLPDKLLGKRDKALLLIGFSGGFRRSEVVGLNVADVVPCTDGLVVTIRKSKTDQEKQGRKVGIPFASSAAHCPVRAYKEWLAASGIKSGAVFRYVDRHGNVGKARLAGEGAAIALKRAVQAAGMDPALFAGHSLRAGLVTSAAREGATEWEIMAQTGHKSPDMVKRYFREANLFKNNAAAKTKL